MREKAIAAIEEYFKQERFRGIVRPYSAEDVEKLCDSIRVEYTFAKRGAARLWKMCYEEPFIRALGALTGGQAKQMVQAGLKAIYVSGWQVAADMNEALETYPDESLYPSDSAPKLVARINNALRRADQIQDLEGETGIDWYVPLVADCEAGFGGEGNVFEITKAMIESGAACVHFEDQLSSAKKCGHLGGKVVIPTSEFVKKLLAARLAADVCGAPILIIARTDAMSAKLLANDVDPCDRKFIVSERDEAGFFRFKGGIEAAIARGLAYAPYADMLWCETSNPNLHDAQRFADAIHEKFPAKLLAYNCSPSFNWKKHLNDDEIAHFQEKLGDMGYKFQFVTLAGFHSMNLAMFQLAKAYAQRGMSAYVDDVQERELTAEADGYTATKHQREVGTGYFDEIQRIISGSGAETVALKDSTEKEQF